MLVIFSLYRNLYLVLQVYLLSLYYHLVTVAMLNLGTVLIEILETYLRMAEKRAEFRTSCSFYLESVAVYKSGELINEEIINRENE